MGNERDDVPLRWRREGQLPFTDDELLGLLQEERNKFTRSNARLVHQYTDELIARRVYPTHWPGPSVHERVHGWGAYWHVWRDPLNCPHCNSDLRDQKWGPPGKREIGLSDGDSVRRWRCPDCGKKWPR